LPEAITYNLNAPKHPSDFYSDLIAYTNLVRLAGLIQMGELVDEYRSFVSRNNIETPRSREEYLLELVITGVLVKNYYSKAIRTGTFSTSLLDSLYRLRRNHEQLKPSVDKLRGVLSYILLQKRTSQIRNYSLRGIRKLLDWLSATGEFKEEVIRLQQWLGFYKGKNREAFNTFITAAVSFADYLERKGEESMGKYVCNVSHFLQNALEHHKFKEDFFFVSRARNEYFMNMFGAEIMNRQMKELFSKMPARAVLLPTCMRTEPPEGCKARDDGKELVCMRCNSICNVGKVATAMRKHKVKAYLIPHSSGFSRFLRKWENTSDTGLIGVTCILNLLTGGYEMKRLNIPAQCIFLDYCACKKHWDPKGPPTALNVQQLVSLVS
ncbi:MAG: DUF116 domain-containing protein, partial [Flavisolibacter sp.]